ncbi:WG repeat-containing protein [Bernardetia sp. OM2101]|uniref:WG repeat-containing protein n=1 Tax=Bernardetia sp. OM2101 TaxID=3344876 RepID=UPI0035D06584
MTTFHKNFATAKDAKGWFHINKNGNEIYSERYLEIEPFYNGFALVTTVPYFF